TEGVGSVGLHGACAHRVAAASGEGFYPPQARLYRPAAYVLGAVVAEAPWVVGDVFPVAGAAAPRSGGPAGRRNGQADKERVGEEHPQDKARSDQAGYRGRDGEEGPERSEPYEHPAPALQP